MRIEFLGVGNFFTKRHNHTNFLVNDRTLIDCGFLVGRGLHESDRTFADIDDIFITHAHADHIGGLEECAFYNRYLADGRRPRLHLPPAVADGLWENSLSGGLLDTESGASTLDDYFEVRVTDEAFTIADVSYRVIPTHHITGRFSCGLVVDDRLYYSGDTRFDRGTVLEQGGPADVIFHEVQFGAGDIHTGLSELATLPEDLRRKTYLVHYGDDYEAHRDEAESAGFRFTRQHVVYTF